MSEDDYDDEVAMAWQMAMGYSIVGLPIGLVVYWIVSLFHGEVDSPTGEQVVLVGFASIGIATFCSYQIRVGRKSVSGSIGAIFGGVSAFMGVIATLFYPEIRAALGLS